VGESFSTASVASLLLLVIVACAVWGRSGPAIVATLLGAILLLGLPVLHDHNAAPGWLEALVVAAAGGGMTGLIAHLRQQHGRELTRALAECESASREAVNQLRVVLDAAPISLVYIDPDKRFLYANHRYAARFHTTPEAMMGK